jgi:hypothetical protein
MSTFKDLLTEATGDKWRWKPKTKIEKWIAKEMWEWLTPAEQKAERINFDLADDSMDFRSAMMHIANGEYKEAARLLKVSGDPELIKAVSKIGSN